MENAPRLRTVGTPCDPSNPGRNTPLEPPLFYWGKCLWGTLLYQYSYCTPLKAIRNYCINKVIEHLGIDLSETYRAHREEGS